jgi:hypothetical protein
MIKKILSTLLVSSSLLVLTTFNAMAERPTVAIGGTVNYGGYVASGTENEGGGITREGYATEQTKRVEAMEVGYSSVFLEVNFVDRITLGLEYMADEVSTDMESRTDTLVGEQVGEALGDTGTSSVKAEFSDMVTAYAEIRLINGMYAKLGAMEIDVATKESLHTSSTYADITLDGMAYGIGYKNSWDNGVFLKTETMMHDWDSFKITAVSSDATPNGNTVEGNLDGAIFSVRLGKEF